MKKPIGAAVASLSLALATAGCARDSHPHGYMIASYDIKDPATFQKYMDAAGPLAPSTRARSSSSIRTRPPWKARARVACGTARYCSAAGLVPKRAARLPAWPRNLGTEGARVIAQRGDRTGGASRCVIHARLSDSHQRVGDQGEGGNVLRLRSRRAGSPPAPGGSANSGEPGTRSSCESHRDQESNLTAPAGPVCVPPAAGIFFSRAERAHRVPVTRARFCDYNDGATAPGPVSSRSVFTMFSIRE
jgi:hypothetical protein